MVSRISARATQLGLVAFLFTSLAVLGFTSTTNNPAPQDRESLAKTFVEQKLRSWQERLNLREWNLQVKLVPSNALEPKTLGNIRWDLDKKEATIGVLSTKDYTLQGQEMLDDMEFTIVHEMVHLHLASLPRSEASRRIEEHAVNELAKALLKLAKR